MRRAVLLLFPTRWRRRHGAEYSRLLADSPLTLGVLTSVGEAAWAARREEARRLGPSAGRAGVLLAVTLVLLFCFFGGWSEIHRQRDLDLQWRIVQLSTLGYALIGVLLHRLGRRWVGGLTAAFAALAWASQMSIIVPGWTQSSAALQVSLVWFLALPCWCAWVTVGGLRGLQETLSIR